MTGHSGWFRDRDPQDTPGTLLRRARLEVGLLIVPVHGAPVGLTQVQMARRLGISREHLSALERDQATISKKLAVSLARVTGVAAARWIEVSLKYEERQQLQGSDKQ